MYTIKEVKSDIKDTELRIRDLKEDLVYLDSEDNHGKLAIQSAISKIQTERTSLLRLAYQIEQDDKIKNRELELKMDKVAAEIGKITGSGNDMEDLSGIYNELFIDSNKVWSDDSDEGYEEDEEDEEDE